MLITELAAEQMTPMQNIENPAYSLYGNEGAARVLIDLLNEAKYDESDNISSHIKDFQRFG
jgi:hypothetical protein